MLAKTLFFLAASVGLILAQDTQSCTASDCASAAPTTSSDAPTMLSAAPTTSSTASTMSSGILTTSSASLTTSSAAPITSSATAITNCAGCVSAVSSWSSIEVFCASNLNLTCACSKLAQLPSLTSCYSSFCTGSAFPSTVQPLVTNLNSMCASATATSGATKNAANRGFMGSAGGIMAAVLGFAIYL